MTQLANGPPPPNQEFGLDDVLLANSPFPISNAAAAEKMIGLVKSYLYAVNVVDTPGDPPADPPAPTAPPDGLPDPPPVFDPSFHDDNIHWVVAKLKDLDLELQWMRAQMTTREYFEAGSVTVSGEGHHAFGSIFATGNAYAVSPMGYVVNVVDYPDYGGRSSATQNAVVYGVGDVSWGANGSLSDPIKVNRLSLVLWPLQAAGQTFYWNLKPNVTITVGALYPKQYNDQTPE
jgi:hypothetical protein